MIIKCDCTDEWMDKTYGKGMRVANRHKGKDGQQYARCVKCLKEHRVAT